MLDVKVTLGEAPKNIFESIDKTIKSQNKIFDLLHLLESIMLNSDIDNNKENAGLSTWKQKIMKELMKHGYSWDGGAHEANKIFGENFGVDWQ